MPKSYVLVATNTKSVNTLIKNLKKYNDALPDKCKMIVEELADKGISIAQSSVAGDRLGQFIIFEKRGISPISKGYEGMLVAIPTRTVVSEWYTSATTTTKAEIDVLLMVEYGSGLGAVTPKPQAVGLVAGRGTFPNQKHAFDSVWHYKSTADDQWYSSAGYPARQPMQKAYEEMYKEIVTVIRGVLAI